MTKLSIIITSRNTRGVLIDCLASIRQFPPECPYEVIVVDDASTDGTAAAVARQFPDVLFLLNDKNLGFAGANNRGLCHARGEYLLLLNSDTLLKQGSLDAMVRCLDQNPAVGIAECQLLNADGSPQRTYNDVPGLLRLLIQSVGIRRLIPRAVLTVLADNLPQAFLPATIAFYLRVYRKTYREQSAPLILGSDVYLSGACLMVRRACFATIGLLDENYFMYAEDSDLCLRAHSAGCKLQFLPDAEVIHLVGASTGPHYRETRIEAHKSTLYFFWKHRGFFSFLGAKLLVIVLVMRVTLTGLFQKRSPALGWRNGTRMLWTIARIWSFPGPREPSLEPLAPSPAEVHRYEEEGLKGSRR